MFGSEFEVSCKTSAHKGKVQILANELKGTMVRENQHKNFDAVNTWCLELSSDPSSMMAVEEPYTQSAGDVMAEIKAALLSRGSMTIRGIGRVFRILDDNRNRQLEVNELLWGLKDFGITLSEAQVKALIKEFDRDGSNSMSFDEFLRALRGEINETRAGYIRQAYNKLDVNQDGQVTLDDIAKLYDVSKHPDVISGKMTP